MEKSSYYKRLLIGNKIQKIFHSLPYLINLFLNCNLKGEVTMKVCYLLGVLSCLLHCKAESDVTEYCEEQCKNVCIPCQDPITCTANQTDCGLKKPDPAFGGVCPPHSKCVEKEFNCMRKEISPY